MKSILIEEVKGLEWAVNIFNVSSFKAVRGDELTEDCSYV